MTPDQNTHHHPVVHDALDKIEDRADALALEAKQLAELNSQLACNVTDLMSLTMELTELVGNHDDSIRNLRYINDGRTAQVHRLMAADRKAGWYIVMVGAAAVFNTAVLAWLVIR